MEEIFEVNSNKDIKEVDIFDFTQDTLPTRQPLKNYQLHPFLHTIQLQTKITSKRRI